jgi:hypothetical protein
VEFLEQQPVADDMLNVIGHHREHRADKEEAEVAMVKRRKSKVFSGFCRYDPHSVPPLR